MGFVSDHARVAAATIDLRLGKLLELTGFCASSTALTERVDLNDLKANCGRYAARLDGWVVVIETGTTHRQILNTWSNAPDVLPSYPRTEERSALLALEARSRKTGQPLLAEVFTGMVNRDGIVTAGQAIRLGDGRSAMVYVAIPAAALSEQLAVLAEGGGAVLGLVDPSHRIVARSSGIERYMFADVPSWFRGSVDAGQAGTSLGMPGPVEIGGIWDAGYHPLSVAPGWMAVAVRPAPKGPWPWTVLSVQSGMALVGLTLSLLLLLWLVAYHDHVTARFAAADKARSEADRKNREKSRLLASFAHDIRSPLISLIGSLEMMDDTRASGPEQIQTARASAEALLQLVDDILELSFLGSGEFTLQPSLVDLRRLAGDLVDQARGAAGRKGLTLHLEVGDPLPAAVEVDRLRLQQVLSNLLSNAVKYTEAGTVTLRISPELRQDGHVAVTFAVTDSGIGLKPGDIPKILSAFGRLERDVERREKGTGLGLAICQRILKAMGTQLTVESAPGKGSTFSFRLTLPGLAEAAVETEARALDGVVIVYAEDEPIIRQVTARRLTAAGATVIEAVDGADALDQLATRTPDLLLLDLQMPGLDGVATIRRLRATDAPPSYPIFVLTSHISGPQAAEARAAGADVVFTKPVQILPLAAALRARRGDGGRHTPTIGGGPGEQGPEMVNLDEFLSVAAVSGETFETTLLPKFGTSMQANLSQLRAAIGDGDLAQAGAVAHRSLGTCQVMGALGLSHQLRQIEIAAKAQDTAALTGLQDGLDAMLEATLAQMRQVLRDRPQTTARPDSPS